MGQAGEDPAEGFGDLDVGGPEVEAHVAVVGTDLVAGEGDDAGELLAVEEDEAARCPVAEIEGVVVEEPADDGPAGVVTEGGAFLAGAPGDVEGLVGNLGQANYSAAKLGIVALSRSIALDMQRFGVRSNCIAPFAWSRMTNSIPAATPEEQARVEKLKRMEGRQVVPLAVFLVGDAGAGVTGQVFAVRGNEIFLMSQSRPLRSVHRSEGWTAETIATHAMPALAAQLYGLERSPDVFSWDPV